ncbi:hypothetical protein BDP55DRAFT_739129 [Colletotrichum godetiae]|uniref:Uncharacterized protein n=1 Tax=Colletotrichum godetiae TaxID=1209918 RepID=A0AAJ0A652_9PEZI|nr:uncharacterized protein BDP55DRAFT_739129 [Colletotrichum godetiae]KAK1656804.1 hypothetical protein BDP55DRAFT_739129 [Colletotrichum godetiae]
MLTSRLLQRTFSAASLKWSLVLLRFTDNQKESPRPSEVSAFNDSSEMDPVQNAIRFWSLSNAENEQWFLQMLTTQFEPLIDNINSGRLHGSWEWLTDNATLTTSIGLPRYTGTTFEGIEAMNDYLAGQYNSEPRMEFVPLLITYGQGHIACHAWYRPSDEEVLSNHPGHNLLITADLNDHKRLVSMEFREYTIWGQETYPERVDNCRACREIASERRSILMEEDTDESSGDEIELGFWSDPFWPGNHNH